MKSNIFDQPINFVRKVNHGEHIVLFYEELEYARMILFEFIKSGLGQREQCIYISEENTEAIKREMADSGIDTNKFMKNGLLYIHQVPGLKDYSPGSEIDIQRLTQIILSNKAEVDQPDRLVLRCIYKIKTEEQIKSNLRWENAFRSKDLKSLSGALICTYPISNIMSTILDSKGSYGKWMNDLLEIYDGVIFARKFWRGVAFDLN
jgi:hypothetical protein